MTSSLVSLLREKTIFSWRVFFAPFPTDDFLSFFLTTLREAVEVEVLRTDLMAVIKSESESTLKVFSLLTGGLGEDLIVLV